MHVGYEGQSNLQLHGVAAAEEEMEVHCLGVVKLPDLRPNIVDRSGMDPSPRFACDHRIVLRGLSSSWAKHLQVRWKLTFQLLLIMSATFLWPAMRRPAAMSLKRMPCLMRIACSQQILRNTSSRHACRQMHQYPTQQSAEDVQNNAMKSVRVLLVADAASKTAQPQTGKSRPNDWGDRPG